jgi:hypothetical protein
MKVLMFGWEFPPHISGGLGTACFGLTESLTKCSQSPDYSEVDDFICVVITFDFQHTDDFYENLPRVSEGEVKNFLDLV